MIMYNFLLWLILVSIVKTDNSDPMSCRSSDIPAPPVLPDQFHMELEVSSYVDGVKNIIVSVLYDLHGNRVAFKWQQENMISFTLLLNYIHNVSIDYNNYACTINHISTQTQPIKLLEELFPMISPLTNSIFKPDAILGVNSNKLCGYCSHSSSSYYTSPPSNRWIYCLTTFEISNDWTDVAWTMPDNQTSSPSGFILMRDKDSTNITARIQLFLTKGDMNQSFQIPEGIPCTSFVTSRPFPSIRESEILHFNVEEMSPAKKAISWSQHLYDNVNNLATEKIIKKPAQTGDQLIEVTATADIRKEIVYIRDSNISECFVRAYVNNTVITLPEDKLPQFKLNTYLELFKRNSWVYVGQRNERNIPVLTWQSNIDSKTRSIAEISFTKKTMAVEGDTQGELDAVENIPIKISIFQNFEENKTRKEISIHRINDFVTEFENMADLSDMDISNCFQAPFIIHLQFQAKVNQVSHMKIENDKQTIRQIQTTIAMICQISILRVPQVEVIQSDAKIFVQFYLLDIHRNTPEDLRLKLISLEKAKQFLQDSIDNNELFFPTLGLYAIPNTLTNVDEDSISSTVSTSSVATQNMESTAESITIEFITTESTLSSKSSSISSTHQEEFTTMLSTTAKTERDNPNHETTHSPKDVAGAAVGTFLFGLVLGASGTLVIREGKRRKILSQSS